MNDRKHLAALGLFLLAAASVLLGLIYLETQPRPAPARRAEAWRNQRYLMQSKADPSRWEALEVLAHDPGQYHRTELTSAQARRWAAEGGFQWVSNQDYNDRLAMAGAHAAGRARAAARPTVVMVSRW